MESKTKKEKKRQERKGIGRRQTDQWKRIWEGSSDDWQRAIGKNEQNREEKKQFSQRKG